MTDALLRGIYEIIAISAVALISDVFLEQKNPSLLKAVKLICSLCITLCIFTQFFMAGTSENLNISFSNVYNGSDNTDTYNSDIFINQTERELSKKVADDIFSHFGINPEQVSIDLSVQYTKNEPSVSLQQITVSFGCTLSEDLYNSILNHLSSITGIDKNTIIIKMTEN